jgi:hypothetical protein
VLKKSLFAVSAKSVSDEAISYVIDFLKSQIAPLAKTAISGL